VSMIVIVVVGLWLYMASHQEAIRNVFTEDERESVEVNLQIDELERRIEKRIDELEK